ncbi:MAG: NAD-dependent epimerase/dehydratase family protein [Ilumatobacteraceae bacterium]|nr:NAD-dependent epimerase/dehydratase family protein [Ilumatobacteraceae bacterium]
MRTLVTGASSRIGCGVVAALAGRGDDVVTLQRRHVAALDAFDVRQVLGDVRDDRIVADAVDGCDAVVHLAARVGVVGSWEDFRSVNVDGTANVLRAARGAGTERLVHVSSPSVAHEGDSLVGEGAGPPIVGRRRAWYPESKAMAEQLVLAPAEGPTRVVAIRPHLVWGPGDEQLVGRIVERARAGRLAMVGTGTALIDTAYVDNAVDALVAAVDALEPDAPCAGRAYVVANGEPRPIAELVAGICAAAGVPFAPRRVPMRVARPVGAFVERAWALLAPRTEPPITEFVAEQLGTAHWFDPRPAAADLRWHPRVSIDDGLARLGEWFAAGCPEWPHAQ